MSKTSEKLYFNAITISLATFQGITWPQSMHQWPQIPHRPSNGWCPSLLPSSLSWTRQLGSEAGSKRLALGPRALPPQATGFRTVAWAEWKWQASLEQPPARSWPRLRQPGQRTCRLGLAAQSWQLSRWRCRCWSRCRHISPWSVRLSSEPRSEVAGLQPLPKLTLLGWLHKPSCNYGVMMF